MKDFFSVDSYFRSEKLKATTKEAVQLAARVVTTCYGYPVLRMTNLLPLFNRDLH